MANDGVCPAKGTFIGNAESMSYGLDSSGNGRLWSISENANRRMLVHVSTREYNDPPTGCPTQEVLHEDAGTSGHGGAG